MTKSRKPPKKLSGRGIHQAGHEGVGEKQLVVDAYVAIVTFLREARLSEDAKRASLQLALDEVEDGMAAQTVSWVEDVKTRWPSAGKGRNEEMD